MIHLHHSNIKCEDCGERHTPGNKDECVEALREQLVDLRETLEAKIRYYAERSDGDKARTEKIRNVLDGIAGSAQEALKDFFND